MMVEQQRMGFGTACAHAVSDVDALAALYAYTDGTRPLVIRSRYRI